MMRPIVAPTDGTVMVGLMSGTSLDGISAAAVRFVERDHAPMEAQLLSYAHRPYAAAERRRLERAMRAGSAQEYCRLHADVGTWLADAAVMAMADCGVARTDIAGIASHGQTLWHEPGHSTWQIGDASQIAERTGCAVIADFRTRDVAAGGHGAPLVPMADAMLFAHATGWRALQNIGGIGNVTVVPSTAAMTSGDLRAVRAFDTGPGVVIIDAVTRLLRPELPYDVDGALASAGTPIVSVVNALLQSPFFLEEPPKSTGREWFSGEFMDAFVGRCRDQGGDAVRDEDMVATATALTAASIIDQYTRYIPEPVADVVISGGGAQNAALMTAIRAGVLGATVWRGSRSVAVTRFDELYFDSEAKEAVAFALLGYLHLTGRSGNVPSATGARGPRSLGAYTAVS